MKKLNFFIIFGIIMLSFLTSSCSSNFMSKYEKKFEQFMNGVAEKLSQKHDLKLLGVVLYGSLQNSGHIRTWGYYHPFTAIEFETSKEFKLEEAQTLIKACLKETIDDVNKNEKLKKMLSRVLPKHVFSVDLLRIRISYTPKSKSLPDHVVYTSPQIEKGYIFYIAPDYVFRKEKILLKEKFQAKDAI